MSARDVIARAFGRIHHASVCNASVFSPTPGQCNCGLHTEADEAIRALTAAGYRIVPPGGLDAESVERLFEAIRAVQDATADYLPPDGIDAQECLNRILQAADNPIINAITLGAQYGRP